MTTPQRYHIAFSLATATAVASFIGALVLSSTRSVAGGLDAEPAAPAARPIAAVVHQLPRVVVSGQVRRVAPTQVVELPRVVVMARRNAAAATLLTEATRLTAPRS